MKKIIKVMIAFFAVLTAAICFLLFYMLRGGAMGAVRFPMLAGLTVERTPIQTRTFEIQDIAGLNIENNSSDIYFIISDQEEMVIKEYADRTIKNSFVDVSRDGNQMNIESMRVRSRRWFVFGSNYRYFEIYLPKSYKGSLTVDSGSGDVQAESDMNLAECSVQTSSGDISFEDLTADHILLKASSGDITAMGLKGEKELSTKSGSIEISESAGAAVITVSSGDVSLEQTDGSLNVKTTSGDADVRIAHLDGDVDIQCGSGDIDCELPKTAGFRFRAGTNSGDINTSFDQRLSFDGRGKNAEGIVGAEAEFTVTAQTGSGDIDFTVR